MLSFLCAIYDYMMCKIFSPWCSLSSEPHLTVFRGFDHHPPQALCLQYPSLSGKGILLNDSEV